MSSLENLTKEQLVVLCRQQQDRLNRLRVAGCVPDASGRVRHQWSTAEIEQIEIMIRQGCSIEQVGQFFNVTGSAIYRACQRAGVSIRRLRQAPADIDAVSNKRCA